MYKQGKEVNTSHVTCTTIIFSNSLTQETYITGTKPNIVVIFYTAYAKL